MQNRIQKENLNSGQGFFFTIEDSLAKLQTAFQEAEIVKTGIFGKALLLDGFTQLTERWEERYHEPLVHPAMLAHPEPRRVLVLGGGDGGTLREVLKHKTVEHVDFAELDPEVVAFCKEYLPKVHKGSFDDKRVRHCYGDARAFVRAAKAEYDVVIMDMTDPEGPARFLYTREFFKLVKKVLNNNNGIFAMHMESPAARPLAFACIKATLLSVFSAVDTALAFVPMYSSLWAYGFAYDKAGPAVGPAAGPAAMSQALLEARIEERMLSAPSFACSKMWPALFAPDPITAEAEKDPMVRIISDSEPDFPDTFEG